MLAVAFDTLKLARKLESAGMQPKLAQDTSAALAESFDECLSWREIHDQQQRIEAKLDKIIAKFGLTRTE
jgi:hypothetical protein